MNVTTDLLPGKPIPVTVEDTETTEPTQPDQPTVPEEPKVRVEDSILLSIKKLLGITREYTQFDADIIMHINSVFMILSQLGVGPEYGFRISDESAVWNDYIANKDNLDAVKSYIHLKVKVLFDPSLSSTVMEAHQQMIRELEWRLNVGTE